MGGVSGQCGCGVVIGAENSAVAGIDCLGPGGIWGAGGLHFIGFLAVARSLLNEGVKVQEARFP
jgi:hypothetical protein